MIDFLLVLFLFCCVVCLVFMVLLTGFIAQLLQRLEKTAGVAPESRAIVNVEKPESRKE